MPKSKVKAESRNLAPFGEDDKMQINEDFKVKVEDWLKVEEGSSTQVCPHLCR
jgi:hypothetical protein